jgi:hypothetical protein
VLFTDNDNRLAYWDAGIEPCHGSRPDNYPLLESDRLPETAADPGYFEANSGGIRRAGVRYRGRWPGADIFGNPGQTGSGDYLSPHAFDPDMPRRDAGGEGLCLNCHDPHGKGQQRDLLVARYGAIAGHAAVGAPEQYALCFSCHGRTGPAGMDLGGRFVEDYYDRGLNGDTAGHQIRKNPAIALSWPSYVQIGDMLPCYDCHNPHGSQGYNRVQPNGALLSDALVGWSGLTNTVGDAPQSRLLCLGCPIPSDGIPGTVVVHGIVMNTLSSQAQHQASGTAACHDCHGRDYSGPTSHNVHNPGSGQDGQDLPAPFEWP